MRVPRLAGDPWPGACPYHGDCVEGLISGSALGARTGQPASELGLDDPVWETVVHALVGLAHNLVLTSLPERILIGGGVMQARPELFDRLRRRLVDSLGGYGFADRIVADQGGFIRPPGLGSRAGPLGAVALGLSALD